MGNLLEFRIDGTDSNNIKYSTNELEEFFLQLKTTDENTNKNIYNIVEITITNGDKNIYYQNLKHFTNLKKLSINDTKLEVMPIEITELINLKYLSLNGINNFSRVIKSPITNIYGLSNLVNLKSLSMHMTTDVFPSEILKLKKLQRLFLTIYSDIALPNKLCDLDDLFVIVINTTFSNIIDKHTFISDGKKAIIDSWNCLTKSYITNEITDLKILKCEFNELVDLPSNIEILRLGTKAKNLPNLPIGLKKLYLYNDLPYFKKEHIKLPFGCELILI